MTSDLIARATLFHKQNAGCDGVKCHEKIDAIAAFAKAEVDAALERAKGAILDFEPPEEEAPDVVLAEAAERVERLKSAPRAAAE